MSLAKRSVQSSIYNIVSQFFQLSILVVRSVLLARTLSPAIFGVYTFSRSIVTITQALPAFGLGSAYVHHAPESDHPDALGVYFTLTTLLTLLWATLLTVGAMLVLGHEQRRVLWVLVASAAISQLAAPARAKLAKAVIFQRIAILDLVIAVVTTIVAIFAAWHGYGVWSLLAIDIVTAAVSIFGFYIIKPVWRPHFAWSPTILRYYLRFGFQTVKAGLLSSVIDRLDDIWTGYVWGDAALGFYSRAYTFANYPRRILATPINSVAIGSYAEVKDDRRRLSQAFFRVNALLIRMGFLLAGILLLISYEFIWLILGEQWVPMLPTFQMMIAYAMLDPMRLTVANLFISIGKPDLLVKIRLTQLGVLCIGLLTLGFYFNIEGVALAVASTTAVGMGILLWKVRAYVDYSFSALFSIPFIALVTGLVATYSALYLLDLSNHWQSATVKLCIFLSVYLGVLILMERQMALELFHMILKLMPAKKRI